MCMHLIDKMFTVVQWILLRKCECILGDRKCIVMVARRWSHLGMYACT